MQTNMDTQKAETGVVTDIYDSTKTYAVGDYCIKDNVLYRCTTAISTAEEWNAAHWIATTIEGELKGKCQKSHATSATTYGVGTGSNYGHCKTINNLTKSSYVNGEALSAYQGKVLKEMIDKHSIFCKLPSEIITTTSYTNISTWQQVQKIGTGLSLSNGVVKIGAGVNTIKISCKVRIYNNDKKDFYGYLKHNQANINESWIVKTVAGPAYDVVTTEAIISVSENDTITFAHYGEGFNVQSNSTTLLVEKIN